MKLQTIRQRENLLRIRGMFRTYVLLKKGRVLVEVRGHADPRPFARGSSPDQYVSNAELATQRAKTVESLLQTMALRAASEQEPLEIEWRSYGVSSEPSYLARFSSPSPWTLEVQPRSAEVQIVPLGVPTVRQQLSDLASHDELDLLDYLYFTIYTITTTGYGDIIPLSAFARFVVSIANLYELFFVAILFNIVAAASR